MPAEALISAARKLFHAALLSGPLTADAKGVLSIADGSSAVSRNVAASLVNRLGIARTAIKGDDGEDSAHGNPGVHRC